MGKIVSYGLEIGDEKHPVLVKEKEIEYFQDCFNDPKTIADMLNEVFRLENQAEEHLYLITFDLAGCLLGVFMVSKGTVNYSISRPREIFIRALAVGASSIVLAHNHPSGSINPSSDDMEVLKGIAEIGNLMGIRLLDFLIIGRPNFYSARNSGDMDNL